MRPVWVPAIAAGELAFSSPDPNGAPGALASPCAQRDHRCDFSRQIQVRACCPET